MSLISHKVTFGGKRLDTPTEPVEMQPRPRISFAIDEPSEPEAVVAAVEPEKPSEPTEPADVNNSSPILASALQALVALAEKPAAPPQPIHLHLASPDLNVRVEQPAPPNLSVDVHVPEQPAPEVFVTVEPPELPAPQPINVTVEAPHQRPRQLEVQRDEQDRIVGYAERVDSQED